MARLHKSAETADGLAHDQGVHLAGVRRVDSGRTRHVRGLNTAATLWCAAAVGVLAGMGFIVEATVGTAAVTVAHLLLRPLAERINRRAPITESSDSDFHFQFSVRCPADHAAVIRAAIMDTVNGDAVILRGGTQEVENEPDTRLIEVEIIAAKQASNIVELPTRRIDLFSRIHSVRWERLTYPLPETSDSANQLKPAQATR